MLKNKLESAIKKLNTFPTDKKIKVFSSTNTDGITASAIMARTLERLNKKFTISFIKNLQKSNIENVPENEAIFLIDIGSGQLNQLEETKREIFVFDHGVIIGKASENIMLLNPLAENQEEISSSGICYFFSKMISKTNIDLANLAVLGMVGDSMEKNISKDYDEILKDSETIVKKSLLIYPATRPLDKALEYSSEPFIPGVSGSYPGSIELLKEANSPKIDGRYKSLYELTEGEMSDLLTAVLLRCESENQETLIGNLYLLNFGGRQEDAREISAKIKACSKMGHPSSALGLCLGNSHYRQEADKHHITYKQNLISSLKYVNEMEKINGENHIIFNTKDKIKDNLLGTVMSIISNSPSYKEGTILVGLANNGNNTKISARHVGKMENGKNVKDLLNSITQNFGVEAMGFPNSAGCTIPKEKEVEFIEKIQETLVTPLAPEIKEMVSKQEGQVEI